MTTHSAPVERRVLLYGDGNINLIDGSTIWLVSMAQVLARTNSHVTLLLKARIISRKMLEPLNGLDNVTVVDPFEGLGDLVPPSRLLSVEEVAERVVELDRAHRFDKIIARGFGICHELARTREFDGRFWPYVIDLPEPGADPTPERLRDLEEISLASERMLVQTGDSRSYMEYRVPASVGKCVVINPMIPDDLGPLRRRSTPQTGRLQGVYAGKLAEGWKTLELCDVPRLLAERGVQMSLSIIGDKIMHSNRTPSWRSRMKTAVTSSPGVEWAGGLSRDDATAYSKTADIGFSWRGQELDSTHELSTKVLEYCAMGVAPVVNRIAAHVELLGEDYPLFVDASLESVLDAIERVARDPDLLEDARKKAMDAIDRYRMANTVERIHAELRATEVRPSVKLAGGRPLLLVGSDLTTSRGTHTVLRQCAGDVRVAQWDPTLTGQEEPRLGELSAAGTVVVEDANPYLVWATRRKVAGQRLIAHVRDLRTDEPVLREAKLDEVDAFVFQAESDLAAFAAAFDVPAERLHHAPLPVDTAYVDRPGLPGRQYRVGVLDLSPSAARPDVAITALRGLLAADEQFSLHIRDQLPWEADEQIDPIERVYYQTLAADLAATPEVAARVAFERPDADLPAWYRKIGWLLVPRRHGRLDQRVVEAQAAGVVVLTPAEEIAAELYGPDTQYGSIDALVRTIVAAAGDSAEFAKLSAGSRLQGGSHDLAVVRPTWEAVLAG
ncbi:glycosyltransferase family 4 protein [Streptomyces sp. SID13031]|uniref:glycosyltransferase family 4 protein n=1 Tax=Streptomyces sp. SID13031 TaxID=2706046 RepID=UPI0013C93853|nr:glycosyltransferase family 4 protein [Streptomyces sp. SID13031]NEA35470.1 glycosyltransferase family 4 protein [Streptomyces sp. SID13031]